MSVISIYKSLSKNRSRYSARRSFLTGGAHHRTLRFESLESRALLACDITASKVDALATGGDVDGDGLFDPGDTIQYTIDIDNSGTTSPADDCTGVSFSDTEDPNTAPVANSINVSPLAFDDTYNAIGNTLLNVSGTPGAGPEVYVNSNVLTNDVDFSGANFDPATTAITGVTPIVNGNTTQMGTVNMNADGTFTYVSAPGFTGTDDFTYTVTDGDLTNTGKVTINVNNVVWYVNNSAALNGDGRSNSPFNTISSATVNGAGGAGDADDPNEIIFVYQGTGTYAQTTQLDLENGQHLIGQGVDLVVSDGVTDHTLVDGSAAQRPTIVNSTNNDVVLASGNTVRGVQIGLVTDLLGGAALLGTIFGTATFGDVEIESGGAGLSLNTGTVATSTAVGTTGAFVSITSAGGTNNVNLIGVTGSVNLGSGALSGASGTSFNVGTTGVVGSGGTVSTTYSGDITKSTGAGAMVSVVNHNTGTITFSGTLIASAGTGLQFDNADSTTSYNFNGTTTLNGGDAGIDIFGSSAGTFNFGSGTSITNPSGIAYREDTSTANVTYSGTIQKNNNATTAIDINAKTGGTTAFGGQITASTVSQNAIDLTNTGGTVNFTGGLDLTTTSGIGFNATGAGATVNATQNNTSIVNTITSSTGTALNVANTAIGASGLTFRSINSTTASGNSGIVLNTTGSSGGLTVTGNGGTCTIVTPTCSGGTISNKTVDGISLTSTTAVSLTRMNIADNAGNGVFGSSVTGFTIAESAVDTNGDAADEAGLRFNNLLGTSNFTNTEIAASGEHNVNIVNTSGTLALLTVSGVTSRDTNTRPLGADGFLLETQNSAAATVLVTGSSSFSSNTTQGIQALALDSSTLTFTVKSSSFNANNEGVVLSTTENADLFATVGGDLVADGNTFTNHLGVSIFVGSGSASTATSLLNGKIKNNTVTTPAGGLNHSIISLVSGASAPSVLQINNNTVTNNGGFDAIRVDTPDSGSSPIFHATLNNNAVTNGATATHGVLAQARQSSNGCIHIEGNTGTVQAGFAVARVRQAAPGTANMEKGVSASATATVVIQDNHPGLPTSIAGTVGVVNNGTCSTLALMASAGGVESELAPETSVVDTANSQADDSTPSTNPTDPSDPFDASPVDDPASETVTPAPTTTSTSTLSNAALGALVSVAIDRWTATGLTAEQIAFLENVSFAISDMPGQYLGVAARGHITLDVDAAGFGWYIDASPLDDSEFQEATSATRLYTTPSLAPAGHIDLLTTVMHELGHQLGLEDTYAQADRDSLMFGYATVGERRLPAFGQAEGAVPETAFHEEYLIGPISLGTLPAGKSLTIKFRVTINNLTNGLAPTISNQGTVSATGISNVLTDDPDAGGAADPTTTTLDSLNLGNQIWIETNHNTTYQSGTDTDVINAPLTLLLSDGTTQVATMTTSDSGTYFFNNLLPGDYIVRVNASYFGSGQPLEGRLSVTGGVDPDTGNVDHDDNGVDSVTASTNGISSQVITLAYNTEPTAGTGNDTNSTLDFGFESFDFGDAPTAAQSGFAASYPTVGLTGARHVIAGPRLGALVDSETDGQPDSGATGDDTTGIDDEDGVTFNPGLVPGQIGSADVVASAVGTLNAWMDFNADGDWADAQEQIATNVALVSGMNTLTFAVPVGATVETATYTRFRLSTAAGLSFSGAAVDGEVEDYQVTLHAQKADEIGVKRENHFLQDVNGTGHWENAGDRFSTFGNPTVDVALVGDWNGDGLDEIGVHRGKQFYLDTNGNGVWNGTGGGDQLFTFGDTTDVPVVGDWDGDGTDEIGVQRGNEFHLDASGDGLWSGVAGGDLSYVFGIAGDTPLPGDWDDNGSDELGVHRGNKFYLDVSSDGSYGGGDAVHTFGNPGDAPLKGDWDGNGADDIGIHRGRMFYLDVNGNGTWNSGVDSILNFGNDTGDTAIIGRWRPVGPLMAAQGAASSPFAGQLLTTDALAPVVQHAIVLWINSGLTTAQQQSLAAVQFQVADLPGALLGLSSGGLITLDTDAAGYGWFIGLTPADNSEFDPSSLPTSAFDDPNSMDLLSAVLHELGHELGYDHDSDLEAMIETLAVGTRWLPS